MWRILLLWVTLFRAEHDNRDSNRVSGQPFVVVERVRLDSEDVHKMTLAQVRHFVVRCQKLVAFGILMSESYELLHCFVLYNKILISRT